jgi:mono/diheme cytochrome c family protein
VTGVGLLRSVAAIASLLAFSVAPGAGSPPVPNLSDPAVIAAGQKLFAERQCAVCHGNDGTGGVRLAGLGDLDPGDVFATIADGRVEGNLRMPAWRGVLSDKEIWQATAYVLALARSP